MEVFEDYEQAARKVPDFHPTMEHQINSHRKLVAKMPKPGAHLQETYTIPRKNSKPLATNKPLKSALDNRVGIR